MSRLNSRSKFISDAGSDPTAQLGYCASQKNLTGAAHLRELLFEAGRGNWLITDGRATRAEGVLTLIDGQKMVAVGWVEERNPTATRMTLGFARLNPTYPNMSLSAVLSVNQVLMGKITVKLGLIYRVIDEHDLEDRSLFERLFDGLRCRGIIDTAIAPQCTDVGEHGLDLQDPNFPAADDNSLDL